MLDKSSEEEKKVEELEEVTKVFYSIYPMEVEI